MFQLSAWIGLTETQDRYDANFRLRRKKVSKDLSLGDGWSFFCKLYPYYDYLAKYWKDKQPVSPPHMLGLSQLSRL